MEMEKKVLFQRMKGLLALVLAFTMMFGTGMTVLADEAKIDFEKINVGDNIHGGTTLYHSYKYSGDIVVYIYDDKNEDKIEEDFNNQTKSPWPGPKYSVKTLENSAGSFTPPVYVSVTLPAGYTYSVKKAAGGNTFWMVRYPLKSNEEVQPVQPAQLVASHEHSFQWVETLEATLESDGLMQHRCECGAVDDEYPISASLVYFHKYCGGNTECTAECTCGMEFGSVPLLYQKNDGRACEETGCIIKDDLYRYGRKQKELYDPGRTGTGRQ